MLSAVVGALPAGFQVYAHWLAVQTNGSDYALWQNLFVFLVVVFLTLAALAAGILLLVPARTRRLGAHLALSGVVVFTLLVVSVRTGWYFRRNALHDLAERSRPLIHAIESYTRDHGRPPSRLAELAPGYLSDIPSTGLSAYPMYPMFEYVVGEEAKGHYHGNDWALYVNTPSGGINFDIFLFLPNGRYPDRGFGGWLEPIGEWAYVHE
ncbi:MAG: hypothetical protein ACREA0_13060, partial [bacterium]